MRRIFKSIALALPGFGTVVRERDRLRAELRKCRGTFAPFGHFYSPMPDVEEVRAREGELFDRMPETIPAIDLNEKAQLSLLEQLTAYYGDLPFPARKEEGRRYFFENGHFRYTDATILYCLMRHVKPNRIVEVGSGYSSAAILDTNERFFGNRISCTFIEPYPELLESLLESGDEEGFTLIPKRLHEVDLALFETLEAGDFLFLDSTHVSKIGSDVNHAFFEILPRLKADVYVHVHDVFYPFEYPREWIYQGRAWQEAYLLRAFLEYNGAFEIVLFNSMLWALHEDVFSTAMPLCCKDKGGSIWLRKLAHKSDARARNG